MDNLKYFKNFLKDDINVKTVIFSPVKESREDSPWEGNPESLAFPIDKDDIYMFGCNSDTGELEDKIDDNVQSDLRDLVKRGLVLIDTQNMLLWYNKRDEETKNTLRTHFNIRPIKRGTNSAFDYENDDEID
jgi:hypothetical protein